MENIKKDQKKKNSYHLLWNVFLSQNYFNVYIYIYIILMCSMEEYKM